MTRKILILIAKVLDRDRVLHQCYSIETAENESNGPLLLDIMNDQYQCLPMTRICIENNPNQYFKESTAQSKVYLAHSRTTTHSHRILKQQKQMLSMYGDNINQLILSLLAM